MATKRAFIHPSRQDQVPNEAKRKRQKPDHGTKSFKKAHPINDLKSHVRSLTRLLNHNDDIPADVRMEKERALHSAQHELDEALRAKKRSEMIGRWHKVRFFDRQKATKKLKRARKELSQCDNEDGNGEERRALEDKVNDAETDVNYAIYYPLEKDYVPLFPTEKRKREGEESEEVGEEPAGEPRRKGDPEMWQKVRQCMADGTLDALRSGRLTEADVVEADHLPEKHAFSGGQKDKVKKLPKKEKKLPGDIHGNRRERRLATIAAKAQVEEDEDSDEGFFE